jgi:hypothetical protein
MRDDRVEEREVLRRHVDPSERLDRLRRDPLRGV